MLFFAAYFITAKTPDKPIFANYVRSRRIMGAALLVLSANYSVHLFCGLRFDHPDAAMRMNLSTYFLCYWLFSSALTALLDRTYITLRRYARHVACWAAFTGDDKYRYVTNFYVSPYMKDTPDGYLHSQRGKARYDRMESILQYNSYKLTADDAMSLLSQVSQAPDPKQATSHTQWSSVYDLSTRSLTLQLLREYGAKVPFEFRVK